MKYEFYGSENLIVSFWYSHQYQCVGVAAPNQKLPTVKLRVAHQFNLGIILLTIKFCFQNSNQKYCPLCSKFDRQRLELQAEISKLKDQLTREAHTGPYPDWETFLFMTEKKGASGPSKSECIDYYKEKYV